MRAPRLTEAELTSLFLNPFYAINIAPALAANHVPMISKQQWVRINVTLIKEMGANAYLARLLDVLEGDYPKA